MRIAHNNFDCTSVKLTKDHLRILKLATRLLDIDRGDFVRECFLRAAIDLGADFVPQAHEAAVPKIAEIYSILKHIDRRAAKSPNPMAIKMSNKAVRALRRAADDGGVGQVDVIASVIENYATVIVRDKLAEQLLLDNPEVVRALGKWAAKAQGKGRKPTDGLERLSRAIAVRSRRDEKIRK